MVKPPKSGRRVTVTPRMLRAGALALATMGADAARQFPGSHADHAVRPPRRLTGHGRPYRGHRFSVRHSQLSEIAESRTESGDEAL
jgi:hypothetical protein